MTNEYIRASDEELADTYEEPMSLAEYVEAAKARPSIAAHAPKYLLQAIESMGTRPVIEEGETRERYRFFDDPANDGEHAVLGNTDVLNGFVDDLRTIAADRGKREKIIWFDGPTATGKSELKRCLINGLRAYSKTEDGRRYTVEWNVASGTEGRGLSYGEERDREDDWYESPVQSHPLSVFPPGVRESILADLDDDHLQTRVDADLDPFSREAYDSLEERYRRAGGTNLFSSITDPRHLRVKNYVVDEGRGIGVLHSEDDGSPKERLVGTWMPEMLRELDSRGRKNPQAFSYDGVLSQGNGILTIVEDASQHADLLRKLLNVPDESRVKLDKGIGMDVDTQLLIISNPDLAVELDKYADRNGRDPLKALKRRLDKHDFRYLTNLSLEAELIRRELTAETAVWTASGYADLDARVREGLTLSMREGGRGVERELAPHAVEAAALYSVVTRLDGEDLPGNRSLVEKALLFDQGFLQEGDERIDADEFEFDGDDGNHGIPVTYTRDVIADLIQTDADRHHPELPVERVVTPEDVLDAMADGLADAPLFSRAETGEYENRLAAVKSHVFDRQEADVLDALLAESSVDEDTVAEYVEHVFAWANDEAVETDRGSTDPDPLLLKVFETEHLGRFDESAYDDATPTDRVEAFRHEKIVTAVNRYAWENRDEDFAIADVDVSEIPVIRAVLDAHDWRDVDRLFDDFDPGRWTDPPSNTQTARLKGETLARLQEAGYSAAAAELTSRKVMREVSYRWD
jgi:non-specific serine/threonine protein kinase